MIRCGLLLLLIFSWAAPAEATRSIGKPTLSGFITGEISDCQSRDKWTRDPQRIPEHPSDLLPNLPMIVWGSGYQGTIFARNLFYPRYWGPVFVRLRLEPDGSLAEAPKIIEALYASQSEIEREARSDSERSWVQVIQRCAPFQVPSSLADHFAERKMICLLLVDKGFPELPGWHPCKAEWDREP